MLPASAAVNDSFREYFGDKGVAELEQALQIIRELKHEPASKTEKAQADIADPLGLDGRME